MQVACSSKAKLRVLQMPCGCHCIAARMPQMLHVPRMPRVQHVLPPRPNATLQPRHDRVAGASPLEARASPHSHSLAKQCSSKKCYWKQTEQEEKVAKE